MRILLCLLFFRAVAPAMAQQENDTIKNLQPILIQAYTSGLPLEEVPASVAYLGTDNLQRFSNANLLPAVNTIPGVRMEERSPGSYRFSIRGSLLRSPFGVRNVKVYWNGLPFTDGGGNTYLNLIDLGSIGSLEVIKGPGGSLYGAGTGGVILLNSPLVKQTKWEASALIGSYGLQRYTISQQLQTRKFSLSMQYATQKSDGYREQTTLSRHAVNADLVVRLSAKSTLTSAFFYTDLDYQTPGGLNQQQYDENPAQARPGAADQKATVYNQTPYLAVSYDHEWNERWSTRIGIFASHSDFKNPTIRNFEERKERNAGARTETQFHFDNKNQNNKIIAGAEYQTFGSPVTVYDNNAGEKGAIQTDDKLSSTWLLLFAQAAYQLPLDFSLTLGASVNFLDYGFTRYQPAPLTSQDKNFNAEFSPRVALLKKVSPFLSIYANASRGFSPPSLAEVRPSTNAFNNSLQAERGINYEAGIRGNAANNTLRFDLAVYDFRLKQTIIIQRLADGADYFVNAGKTSQRGAEALITWHPINNAKTFFSDFKIWNSYALNHYRFKEYVNDLTDYSGNKLTGVPPTVNVSGLDVVVKQKFYVNTTANYVDHIPVNDANNVYAAEYFLLGARAGFKTGMKAHHLDIFAGIDNALDKKYSLGNDLNAVLGGRYFNAASPRNFYAGLKFTMVP